MTGAMFRSILKAVLEYNGLNPQLYSGHSLRSGCTSDMLDMQISIGLIKVLGHWRRNAVYSYFNN